MFGKNQKIIKIFSSRWFTLLVLAIIFLIGVAFYKDYQNQKDINQELDSLQANIEGLEGKKVELSKLIDILETSNYVEREARQRLGLKKPGEKVISVPENARPEPKVLGAATELAPGRPAPLQWFDYFFLKTIE
jgi:cell division protein FtsB